MMKLLASVLMFAAVSGWAQAPAGNEASPMAKPPEGKKMEAKAAPAKAAETKAAIKVEKILVATGVENREAVGAAESFGADVGQVTCWVKLAVAEPPAKVKFVWSMGGKQVYEHPLDIKSSGRWWAAKKVSAGSWKVELQSEDGASLGSAEFTVGEAKAAK